MLLPDREEGARSAGLCSELLANLRDLPTWSADPDPTRRAFAQHLATWAQAHWGPYADPPLPAPAMAWLRDWLPPSDALPAGPVLVLGCGAGGELPYLTLPGRQLLAVDAHPMLVQFAQAVATGFAQVPYRQRPDRFGVRPLRVPPPLRHVLAATEFACANALDPPLPAESCAMVVALNLVDSVPDPFVLLQQCEALLRPGGVLLLSSPYNWQEAITPQTHWFDRHIPPTLGQVAGVEALLTGRLMPGFLDSLHVERSADGVVWDLAVHERYTARYLLHVVRLRKAY